MTDLPDISPAVGGFCDSVEVEAEPEILLLGCVKGKRPGRHRAVDLYDSPLWNARRGYAETSGRPWFAISALYGLVEPERELEFYDLVLGDRPAAERREWGETVARDLEKRLGPLHGRVIEIHAGGQYIRALRRPLGMRGARLVTPVADIAGIGGQLNWYKTHNPASISASPVSRRRRASADEVEAAVRALDREPQILDAATWPGSLTSLDVPGMYSWWVDADGASDLSTGLGLAVLAGRIYAGLTGATKWPSGGIGKNTLRKRIGGSHIHGRIGGSTFRFTLAAALHDTIDLDVLGPARLAPAGEAALTRWIKRHLSVAVHRFPDPDPLGDLEHRVLAILDPPLNLDGMAPTPLRRRLKELRREIANYSIAL